MMLSDITLCSQVDKVTEEEKRIVLEEVKDDKPPVGVDFITYMIHAGKMDVKTIAVNAVDLMIAGADTVKETCVTCYIVYTV